ncbi:hypothetical protein TRVA0_059S00298 [Trichomonascus vanleenenianus]|uniref:uncharacterized protein n=1 Tax=Trichomonascus vanleenenianus TaxID=2268995 RepID=UPI003EC9876F
MHGIFVRPGVVKNQLSSARSARTVSGGSVVMKTPPQLKPPVDPRSTQTSPSDSSSILDYATIRAKKSFVMTPRALSKPNRQPHTPPEQAAKDPEIMSRPIPQPFARSIFTQSPVQENDTAGLTRQIENLRSKLKVMEKKRINDRDQIQADSQRIRKLENIIKRLQTKLTPMHEEIISLREKLKELEEEPVTGQFDEEALELATLDKEMAEEKAEMLKEEFDALKKKFEDLELECEILREENAVFTTNESSGGEQGTILRLEKRNEKLEEALLRMRDIYSTKEFEMKNRIASLQKSVSEGEMLSTNFNITNEKLKDAESVISDLRVQLDNALGAESMIESLTEQNLELSEQCEELKNTIEELETLKELNDEIESSHVFREKQLQEEIEELQTASTETNAKIAQVENRNEYLESAILKFRDLVSTLNTELKTLKDDSESRQVQDQKREIAEMDLNPVSSSIIRTMDLDLKKFESIQAIKHLEIVKCYLPEEYGSDEESIESLLCFERIHFLSGIIYAYFKEQLSRGENITLHAKICAGLFDIMAVSARAVETLSVTSVEQFQQVGSILEKISPAEEQLRKDTQALRKENLNEKEFLKSINMYAIRFRRIADEELHELKQPVMNAARFDGIHSLCDLALSINRAVNVDTFSLDIVSRTKVVAKKYSDQLKEITDRHKGARQDTIYKLQPKDDDMLDKMYNRCREVVNYVIAISSQIDETDGDTPDFLAAFSQLRLDGQVNSLDDYLSKWSELKSISLNDLVSLVRPMSPWTIKAEHFKQLKDNSKQKDQEIEELKSQAQKLATALRSKERSIEELEVKVEHLDSKLVKSKDHDKTMAELKQALKTSHDTQKQLEAKVEELKASAPQVVISTPKPEAERKDTLKLQVRQLKSALDYYSKGGHLQPGHSWTLAPLNLTQGRTQSLVYSKCHGLFKNIQRAVSTFESYRVKSSELSWKTSHARAHARIHVLAQIESLETLKLQVVDLVSEARMFSWRS